MGNDPKTWIDSVFRRFCSNELYEGIAGDLLELYEYEVTTIGHRKAKLKYKLRILGFFRTAFSKKINQLKLNISMWRNFLVITLRNMTKHKAHAAINLMGLAIGLAAGFMILQYVYFETSYDNFFENKENIYRVQTNRYNKGELTTQWAAGCAGVGLHMYEDFPEVVSFVNLHRSGANISYNENIFKPDFAYYAGQDFFNIFSIPLLRGTDSLVLKEPYTVALSQSMAKKLFGDEDPMGKNVKLNEEDNFMVTGIYEDLPEKSHMKFDLLYSFATYTIYSGEGTRTAWQWDGFLNYIVLQDGTDYQKFEAKFPEWVDSRPEMEDSEERGWDMDFVLQPLTDIHLISNYRSEIKPTGNKTATYFLLIIGMFVLFIAWINYINLATARSLSRAKEVGIRKVMGSYKSQIFNQFMFESSFLNVLGLLIAVILVAVAYPYFSDFLGRSESYTLPDQPWFWLGLAALFLGGIFLSGLYPSLVLSRFNPAMVLKGKFSNSSQGNIVRQGLVVFQFLASVVLITGTYIVYEQLQYLQNQDLGFKMDQTLVVKAPNLSDSVMEIREEIFTNRLTQESFVTKMAGSTAVPGRSPGWNAGGLRLLSQPESESNQYRVIGADENYLDFYNLSVIAGRGFDKSFGNEESNILLNEAGLNLLGFSDPDDVLNQDFYFWGDTFKIVGIVKNYRQESPKAAYDAMVFRYYESPGRLYSVAINTKDMRNAIETIEGHWAAAFGDKPLDYFFLDDYYNQQYKLEMRFGTIFTIFSALAIFVACLGLFGLASYMTSLRTKEVGVRKVLGASQATLLYLLSRDFLKLVGISILVSIPITWWIMNGWLENFATRISLSPWLFILPAIALIVIAIATVSYHTLQAANMNPAKTLKDE